MARFESHLERALRLLGAAALVACVATPAQAQFWKRAPADYEECAEAAAAATSAHARAKHIAQCEASFAGRRKPGGGYVYYDLLQDRSFDIAGPNPTAAELKAIDEHYTRFLAERKRAMIAEAFAAKQQETQRGIAQPDAVKKPPLPRPRPTLASLKPKRDCERDPLACGVSRLAEGFTSVARTLFGGAPAKGRGG